MNEHLRILRAASVLLVCVLCQGCLPGRRAWEHPIIVNRLMALDGVVVESAGVSNGNLGSTHAVLRVRERGLLKLSGLTLDSFEPGAPVMADQVGEHRPQWVGFGYWGVIDKAGRPRRGAAIGGAIDLSVDSPFGAVLPVRGNTLQDVVNAYDEIVETLSTWPDCPKAASVVGQDGTEYRYCSRLASAKGSWFPGPQYPPEWDRPWEIDSQTSTGADAAGRQAR